MVICISILGKIIQVTGSMEGKEECFFIWGGVEGGGLNFEGIKFDDIYYYVKCYVTLGHFVGGSSGHRLPYSLSGSALSLHLAMFY